MLSSPPPTADAAAGQLQKAADALQQPPAGQGGAPALPSTRMELSRQQLVAALEHLPDGKRFDVLYFDEEQETFSPAMATMSPEVRGGAIAFATDVQSGGATAAVDAMRAAYALKAKNIVFLSDGMANVGGTPEEMLDEARAQMKAGVKFFTIGLGNGVREDILSALANESGGTVTLR